LVVDGAVLVQWSRFVSAVTPEAGRYDVILPG
jgi:hypothetical protein